MPCQNITLQYNYQGVETFESCHNGKFQQAASNVSALFLYILLAVSISMHFPRTKGITNLARNYIVHYSAAIKKFMLFWTMSSIFPQVHLVGNFSTPPPPTRNHILFKRILYKCKYLEDCLYNCLDTSGKKQKNYHNFLIFTFETSKNRIKKSPISAQILSAIKSNDQLSTDSQCNG